jgi:hypothetical protein
MTRSKLMMMLIAATTLAVSPIAFAQKPGKPLTNDDVIVMVKKKLPESVIISAIQSGPSKFDTSSNELIRLNSAGLSEKELNAILSASGNGTAGAPGSASAGLADASIPKSRMPHATVTQGNSSQELKIEKTQLAETKTKPSSLKSLAGDSAVAQAMHAGVSTATYGVASHMNSSIGGSTVQEAGSIFSSMMSHRTPTVTYVWGVPSPASGNLLQSSKPTFTVDFSRTPGVSADDYEPAIVKLTPAQNACRIIGATQGKADASSSPAADWQIYSHFLEERVAATPQKLGSGKYKLTASTELMPGEYGLVIRPVSKSKTFSGGDVARAQGDGLMFDTIWTFQVSE